VPNDDLRVTLAAEGTGTPVALTAKRPAPKKPAAKKRAASKKAAAKEGEPVG
jgi:hypothetical protein